MFQRLRTKLVRIRGTQFRRGFLLIEGMIASVILAVAALGIVSLLLSAHEQQIALQENSTGVLLAKQLIEEIAAKPFAQAILYNNYTDTTSTMRTLSGEVVMPGDGEVYSRLVAVQPVTPTGSNATVGDVQLVQVTVTTPSRQAVTISRLITNVNWP
jgi:Tfp pilus assembly protein PilV